LKKLNLLQYKTRRSAFTTNLFALRRSRRKFGPSEKQLLPSSKLLRTRFSKRLVLSNSLNRM
jgi:hypothetical protein